MIIRLSAIGDVVRVLPALHLLRDAHPDAQIDWVVEPKSADIVSGHPCLDRLVVFERSSQGLGPVKAFWRLCRDIRAARYDLVVDFHGILKSGLLMGISGARLRYGFARPRSQEASWLFANRRVNVRSGATPGSRPMNRIEENLVLCEAVTGRSKRSDREPNVIIYVPRDVQEEVDRYVEEVFEGGKLVVAMHVPVDREEKRWPAEHFAQLCDFLIADGRFEVLLTWGPGQFDQLEPILGLARRRPVVAPETPDLKHYAWLVHRASLYFGCDTGPMHIASMMGTPVVAVFGGTDPAQHAPYRQPYETLTADVGPGPYARSVRQKLETITPEMAYDACVRIVTRQKRA